MSPLGYPTTAISNQNPLMSLSSALRFSSSLLRQNLTPTQFSRFPRKLSGLRLLSVHSRRPVRPLCARRRDDSPKENIDGQGQEGGGNGSLTQVLKDAGNGGRIVPAELHKEATESYMAYALSVLLGRALPDVRDGLKPVHRRIL